MMLDSSSGERQLGDGPEAVWPSKMSTLFRSQSRMETARVCGESQERPSRWAVPEQAFPHQIELLRWEGNRLPLRLGSSSQPKMVFEFVSNVGES